MQLANNLKLNLMGVIMDSRVSQILLGLITAVIATIIALTLLDIYTGGRIFLWVVW